MKLADHKATLSFSNGAPSMELPVYAGTIGPNVIDIRTVGLVAGIQFAAHADGVGKRGYEVFRECFENGLLVRASGDTIALSPALIVEKAEIDRMMELLADGIRKAG